MVCSSLKQGGKDFTAAYIYWHLSEETVDPEKEEKLIIIKIDDIDWVISINIDYINCICTGILVKTQTVDPIFSKVSMHYL